MASAKTSNPQTWNRYSYALNNPLRYIDPNGMEVDEDCVNDPECQIEVSINVIWDKNAYGGKGLKKDQKKKIEAEQLAKAKEDYGVSNIVLNIKYTEGEYDSETKQYSSIDPKSINVFVTDVLYKNLAGLSGRIKDSDIAIVQLSANKSSNNTPGHELGHQFLGHVGKDRIMAPLDNLFYDGSINLRLFFQSNFGFSQKAMREGLAPRIYAVPLNPESNKPKQE